MEYAAESRQTEIAEELMAFFLEHQLHDCFAASLYQMYDLLHPDVIMELAWKHKIMDVAMPYMIQVMREFQNRVDKLELAEKARREDQDEATKQQQGAMLYRECGSLACIAHTSAEPQLMLTYGAQGNPMAPVGNGPYGAGPAYATHPPGYGYPGM
jgi:clathrin heavy chain